MTSKYKAKQEAAKKTSLAGEVPVAGKAKKGPVNRKMLLRLKQRIRAWENPESPKSAFSAAKSRGGCKCPGSFTKPAPRGRH